jgi:flavin reductase (DIM6/NTAB) family NADH-FMN oxidoreductase RutF
MRHIEPEELAIRPFELLDKQWALLVGGTGKPNPMTVSWGGFGTLWHKPTVTVYVRPTRFTYGLLNEHDEFTLNFLPESFREAVDLCGHKSGRDLDKWKASGLHPEPAESVSVPRVKEAELAFECRILARLDFDPKKFADETVHENYPKKDYHRIYWGEVLSLWAVDKYTRG